MGIIFRNSNFSAKREKGKIFENMKLSVAIFSSVAASTASTQITDPYKMAKPEKAQRDDSNQSVRSVPKTCKANFDMLNAYWKPTSNQIKKPRLTVVNKKRSGYIDIEKFGNDMNCFIDVVADSSCQSIKAEIVHAGMEQCAANKGYNPDPNGTHPTNAPCFCDKFWFNEESTTAATSPGGICGCGGTNGAFKRPYSAKHLLWDQGLPSYGCNDGLPYGDRGTWFMAWMSEIGNWEKRVFAGNEFKFNLFTDSSIRGGNIRVEWEGVGCSEPEAPKNALELLDQLTDWSNWTINDILLGHKHHNDWVYKFASNAKRMARSYHKCGIPDALPFDAHPEWVSLDSDLSQAITDITTGLSKWSDAFLGKCPGQKKRYHHNRRMKKWNSNLKKIISKHQLI